jgi:hypothetical protein
MRRLFLRMITNGPAVRKLKFTKERRGLIQGVRIFAVVITASICGRKNWIQSIAGMAKCIAVSGEKVGFGV